MRIESFGLSDIGRKRKNNEDVFATLDEMQFYALADGMGGHQAGEIAAQLAVENICKSFRNFLKDEILSLPRASSLLLETFSYAIEKANMHVHMMSQERDDWAGMGTTLSCILLHHKELFFGHVGDSRIYQYRDALRQLTRDHISSSDRKKGKITKAIGTSSYLEPQVGTISPFNNDLYLICSDGLTDHLSDDELAQAIKTYQMNPRLLCQRLVEAANEKGGHDNITVIAVKIIDS